jgi:hypothetical protein
MNGGGQHGSAVASQAAGGVDELLKEVFSGVMQECALEVALRVACGHAVRPDQKRHAP